MLRYSIIFFLSVIYVSTALAGDAYKVDVKGSKTEWIGRKVTGEHHGTIALKSGSLVFEGDKLVGGEFEMDMSSIINLDIEDKSMKDKLIGHLKSDDFFSVEKFPVARFKITHVQKNENKEGDNYFIRGDMTIKGITKPVEFSAKINISSGKVDGTALVIIDRSKFDVRYGSGSFFEGLGDKLIYDDFTLKIILKAVKA